MGGVAYFVCIVTTTLTFAFYSWTANLQNCTCRPNVGAIVDLYSGLARDYRDSSLQRPAL